MIDRRTSESRPDSAKELLILFSEAFNMRSHLERDDMGVLFPMCRAARQRLLK